MFKVNNKNSRTTSSTLCKVAVLKNFAKFTGKYLCQKVDAYSFFNKQTLAQVFLCEVCKIFKNTFFYGTTPVATSGISDNVPSVVAQS